jgi:SAM-dependent methyltransferase
VDGTTGERARQGRKFGPAAEDYERGRPGYPREIVEAAVAALGLGPEATVVDVGAGTGKLTRLLVERFARVVAVEPLRPMRELLAASLPRVDAREGTAERLPLGDGDAAAVFVAEAFHWFDGPAALAEAARVLAPGGGIVLLWNLPAGGWDPPLPDRARALFREAISRGGEPGGPAVQQGQWRDAFAGSAFGELHPVELTHQFERDRDGLIANAMSVSSIAGLPPADRAALRERLTRLLPDTTYRQPLRTELHWARLEDGRWCDRCGRARDSGEHGACAAARELEPPRFCPRCRRRMKVQVLPGGWSASCVAHGETRSPRP